MKTTRSTQNHGEARRSFLRQATALSSIAGTSFAANLLGFGHAAAQSSDSKSLVCIYLNGGNDQSNTVVPCAGSEYATYVASRGGVALKPEQLVAIRPANWSGAPLALNKSLAGIASLFENGKVAVVANVGTLAAPITLKEWNNGAPVVPTPTQLFSHSDQTGAWQTGLPDRPSATGWLGRIGDMTASRYNAGSPVSIAMSVGGNNIMQTGTSTVQYQLTVDGAVKVRALESLYDSTTNAAILKNLMTTKRSNLLESELAVISTRALAAESTVTSALAANPMTTVFPNTPIGRQLKMVARMIGARSALNQRRQIFYVRADGYDNHDALVADQGARLAELNDAMVALYNATREFGSADSVTTFTTSDFGRSLQSNGRGTDHGWGAHHFVMGAAVKGGSVYGEFPTVALKTKQDAGQGRLIPTTSVDEYAATIARWFGVADSDLGIVLPNLHRFSRANLSFLA